MFDVMTGVRQGCILSHFILLITIDFITTKAMDDASFRIVWREKRLADVDFVDDISATSHTLAGIQGITNNIETCGAKIGLMINCEKTKAMKIGPEQHPPIPIMQHNLDYVKKFSYLGSYKTSNGVKLRVYTTIVIPTAIYACETWKRTVMITHRLDVFHRRCLRAILGISWRERATNEEVMRRAGMGRLQDIVATRRRKMAGHVRRLQRKRPAHTAM